jgi:hypothetical protein
MRRPASILVLALTLTACATPEPPATIRRAEAVPEPVEITIHTSPAGGIVDWNGNVLGAAPITITVHPELTYTGRPRWPYNGRLSQKFRARWPDGSMNFELFGSDEPIPQNIGIVSPRYRHNPLLDALIKDAHTPRELTQKRTGP